MRAALAGLQKTGKKWEKARFWNGIGQVKFRGARTGLCRGDFLYQFFQIFELSEPQQRSGVLNPSARITKHTKHTDRILFPGIPGACLPFAFPYQKRRIRVN
jgi:hypothetical protein